jgi:hypothetical protein
LIRTLLTTMANPANAATVLIVAAKFALPILILRFPFAAGWANFALDGIDGDLLIPLGLPDEIYQPVDKISDWVTYVAIVIVGYRNQWPIKRLMLGLFIFRSVGQVAFLLTEEELFLALFPNFLEPLFLVTATILGRGFAVLDRYKWPTGILIVVYKLQDEWFTHVANIDRSEWLQQLFEGLFGG